MNETLNDMMEIDHVIEVLDDGSVIDRPDLYAPELFGEEQGTETIEGWTLMDGYSGQDRYSGPIMHNSEFIGGRMERDILEAPGVYVALACCWLDMLEEDDPYEGWAVARKNS